MATTTSFFIYEIRWLRWLHIGSWILWIALTSFELYVPANEYIYSSRRKALFLAVLFAIAVFESYGLAAHVCLAVAIHRGSGWKLVLPYFIYELIMTTVSFMGVCIGVIVLENYVYLSGLLLFVLRLRLLLYFASYCGYLRREDNLRLNASGGLHNDA